MNLRLRRSLAGCLLVAASLAGIGCGSSSKAPTILNTEKVERAIEHSSLDQRGRHVHVSCPAGVHQKKGLVFNCTTITAGTTTRFVVTQMDGAGRVHYEAR
jgi:Domain of unknown function (DUF4333)